MTLFSNPAVGPEGVKVPPLSPLAAGMNIVSLGWLAFGVATSGPGGLSRAGVAHFVLLGVACLAWLVWVGARSRVWPNWTQDASLAVMAVAGGALTGLVPLAMVFPAVAALGITLARPGHQPLWVMAAGGAATAISVPAAGESVGILIGALSVIVAGATMGLSRRVSVERQMHAATLALARAEADAETARAELLAGRNHLARELHDVLAHSLAALSLQIEALDALMSDAQTTPAVRAQVERIKRLVHDGLDEARGAVAALREDLPPLDERLSKLAAERHAGIEVSGRPRNLAPEVAMALYRVAQEALTNAMKHAPGTHADVHLDYAEKEVNLSISNPAAAGDVATDLAGTGGGYGLQGIRERILLVGGRVNAGPVAGGWRVDAQVPA